MPKLDLESLESVFDDKDSSPGLLYSAATESISDLINELRASREYIDATHAYQKLRTLESLERFQVARKAYDAAINGESR